jgi:predicted ArsR family transcriptional regulator
MSPRTLAAVHRPAAEIDRLLLRHLHASRDAVTAAELAMRIGCGAERCRQHLTRLEREGHARRRDTEGGSRWTAH